MPYAPFHDYFPELAEEETRSFTVFDDARMPAGSYGLIESFCNKRGCDCRRVFFSVISSRSRQIEAVIAYGWESIEFYAQWMGDDELDMIRDMQGPILNPLSPQSHHAPAILEMVRDVVLQDTAYVDRVKAHYEMFRDQIDRPLPQRNTKKRKKAKRKRRR